MSIFPIIIQAVVAAWQSRFHNLTFLTLWLSLLPLDTFAESAIPSSTTNCTLLSRGFSNELTQQEVTLHTFITDFVGTLKDGNFRRIHTFFHSRSKVKESIGDKLEAILQNRYEKPWQYSLFRAWKIQSQEGNKEIISTCPESEGALIISQFGYPKQFVLWIQIMGQNELGRLVLALAPEKESLKIVAFRVQQWTQGGNDWEKWLERAQNLKRSNNLKQAYIAFDIAQKLIQTEDLLLYPMRSTIISERDQVMTQAQALDSVNQAAKTQTIAYVGSLMTREGTGLLIREITSTDLSAHAYKEICEKRGKSLMTDGWLQKGQGIRCNYIAKGMDPTMDSGLGGFYLTPEDLKNQ